MEINNYAFLQYIADKMVPVILSTGMANISEIRKAVNLFQQANNNQLILLHCVSIYPAEPSIIHLNNILGLRKAFSSYPIGFFIPPSYLESFFAPRETIFNILKKMEILINKFSFLCNYSDHFIIHISTND
jgi:hypothetical protein